MLILLCTQAWENMPCVHIKFNKLLIVHCLAKIVHTDYYTNGTFASSACECK